MADKKKPEKKRPFALEFLEIPSGELAQVTGGGSGITTMAITVPKHGKHYDQV
jgi:hypothetical protein